MSQQVTDKINYLKAEIRAAKEYIKEYGKQIESLQDFIEEIRLRHAPQQGSRDVEDNSKVYCLSCTNSYDQERIMWPCRPAQEIIAKVKFIDVFIPEEE